MDEQAVKAMQFQSAIAATHSPDDFTPITCIDDLFDLPAHMPPNYDFSKLTPSDYQYIIALAKKEIEEAKAEKK